MFAPTKDWWLNWLLVNGCQLTTFYFKQQSNMNERKKKPLRILLIILTFAELLYLILLFSNLLYLGGYNLVNNLEMGLQLFHIVVALIVIKYIWVNELVSTKLKIENTLLVLIFGIIGMWLWFPAGDKKRKFI